MAIFTIENLLDGFMTSNSALSPRFTTIEYRGIGGHAEVSEGEENMINNSNMTWQGGYTGLILEHIRNSQEPLPTAFQTTTGGYTSLVLGNFNVDDMDLEALDWTLRTNENNGEQINDNVQSDNRETTNIEGDKDSHEERSETSKVHESIEEEIDGSQELREAEIEAFIESEQVAASEGNNTNLNSKYTPQIGMEFKNKDEAHHFFNFYAFIAGFEVVITHVSRTTDRKRNNEIFKVEMKCKCHGKPPKKKITGEEEDEIQVDTNPTKKGPKRRTNVQVKTNCSVVMVVKETNGIWKVTRLDLDHNHELRPNNRDQLFSGHKYMTEMEKSMIRTLNDNNIPKRKMISILSYLRAYKGLPEEFEDVVDNSLTKEEFEYLWKKMILDFKLENNKYFSKTWEMRERFIPVYFKDNFFPFLQSTARREGTNSRYKDNVGPTYSITSFLREHQRIVDATNIAEDNEDNFNKLKTTKELEYGYNIELIMR
ncbi:hypothetical protein C2845_PM15G00960 [Panicum miliaceum]|uniref:FAR1 domain-containing protein n=1 Tax=Panicum miliaceum TaxID=4540 RepID=A0A3L6QAT4_PANMI|nr:hypothetical protein C2845_PM15G00960 [Panicum miliaceum]